MRRIRIFSLIACLFFISLQPSQAILVQAASAPGHANSPTNGSRAQALLAMPPLDKTIADVTLGSLSHTFDGSAKAATAETNPSGLTVVITYTGTSGTSFGPTTTAPTNAGTYTVDAAIDDTTYQGTATGTMTIAPATTTTTLASSSNPSTFLDTVYITATVAPSAATGTVQFYADGSALSSAIALASGTTSYSTNGLSGGTHVITATYSGDVNYAASTGTLSGGQVVNKASATVELSNTSQVYDGTPRVVSATTDPVGQTVVITYTGTGDTTYGPSTTAPSIAGTFALSAAISSTNYAGSASGTLTVDKAESTDFGHLRSQSVRLWQSDSHHGNHFAGAGHRHGAIPIGLGEHRLAGSVSQQPGRLYHLGPGRRHPHPLCRLCFSRRESQRGRELG